jgi:hypothetical protein
VKKIGMKSGGKGEKRFAIGDSRNRREVRREEPEGERLD